jgi:hypothetical protein
MLQDVRRPIPDFYFYLLTLSSPVFALPTPTALGFLDYFTNAPSRCNPVVECVLVIGHEVRKTNPSLHNPEFHDRSYLGSNWAVPLTDGSGWG